MGLSVVMATLNVTEIGAKLRKKLKCLGEVTINVTVVHNKRNKGNKHKRGHRIWLTKAVSKTLFRFRC
jgi:ribosomal protein L21